MGRRGEALAAAWYESNGFEVLDTNWRCRAGELDLVCRRGHILVVSEVKSRSTAAFGAPAEAVGPAKQRRLRALAACYLAAHELRPTRVRFDVVSLLGDELEVLEAAF